MANDVTVNLRPMARRVFGQSPRYREIPPRCRRYAEARRPDPRTYAPLIHSILPTVRHLAPLHRGPIVRRSIFHAEIVRNH